MNIVKRWTSGIVSRIDWLAGQVENQEALVDSTIKDIQKAAARATVQLRRVNRDGQALTESVVRDEENAKIWRERARNCPPYDEKTALECLRRSKNSERRAASQQNRLTTHARMEDQLKRDIKKAEERLIGLKEKRNLMVTRQSRAEALNGVEAMNASCDIDQIFDRWETQVMEAELNFLHEKEDDELELSFASKEEDEELRHELTLLRSETSMETSSE